MDFGSHPLAQHSLEPLYTPLGIVHLSLGEHNERTWRITQNILTTWLLGCYVLFLPTFCWQAVVMALLRCKGFGTFVTNFNLSSAQYQLAHWFLIHLSTCFLFIARKYFLLCFLLVSHKYL